MALAYVTSVVTVSYTHLMLPTNREVVACVVLRDGYQCNQQELIEFCESAVGKFKSPKTVYFFDDLPKGPSGKILRLKLPELIDKILVSD